MAKPQTRSGYSTEQTLTCERVLVTLLHGLGQWRESVYLVGGLAPRYLARAGAPTHVGTIDVDVVLDHQPLVGAEANHSLEENLRRMGFAPSGRDTEKDLAWRWHVRTTGDTKTVLEFLTDAPGKRGGQPQPLPTANGVSALNVRHSSMVFGHHQVAKVRAELLVDKRSATESIRYADVVSFTCLKAFAFKRRREPKDAYDLVYCIEHAPEGFEAAFESLREARSGRHSAVLEDTVRILKRDFVSDAKTEGYRKDGPVAVAKFELDAGEPREEQILRQRQVAALVEHGVSRIG